MARRAPLLLLLAALSAVAQSPKDTHVFDVLYIPKEWRNQSAGDLKAAGLRARLDRFGRDLKLEILSVKDANALIASHTVVLLDFQHTPLEMHATMLREALNQRARCPRTDLTFIAAGPSPGSFEKFLLSNRESVAVLVAAEHLQVSPPADCAGPPPAWKMYWTPAAEPDIFGSFGAWFDVSSAPMRVIPVSADFTWVEVLYACHGDTFEPYDAPLTAGPACPEDGSPPVWNSARADLARLIELGVAAFPWVFPLADSSPEAVERNRRKAASLANLLGGYVASSELSGNGSGLARLLAATSRGYLLRMKGPARPYEKFVQLEVSATPPEQLLAKRGYQFDPQARKPRPVGIRDDGPLTVYVPQGNFEARLEPDHLLLTLPVKQPAGQQAGQTPKVQVIVEPLGSAPDTKPLRSRTAIPWADIQDSPDGPTVKVPMPASWTGITRIIVFDEASRWAGARTFDLAPPAPARP